MDSSKSNSIQCGRLKACEILYSNQVDSEGVEKCVEVFLDKEVVVDSEVNGFKGKGLPIKVSLGGSLKLIFRRNKRGGYLRKIVDSKYLSPLRFPKNTRPFKEFICLKELRNIGIPVPEPILAIVKKRGLVFYEGGLFTREVVQASTLLDLVLTIEPAQLREHSYNTGLWAVRALELGYLHPDLHLGNVLVRFSGISLIDFDKFKSVSDKDYAVKYLKERWNRGVEKRVADDSRKAILKDSFVSGMEYGQRS